MINIKAVVYSVLILALLAICCNARAMHQDEEDTGLFSKRKNNYQELVDQLLEKRANNNPNNYAPYGALCGNPNYPCNGPCTGGPNGLGPGYCFCNPLGAPCRSNSDCCGGGTTLGGGPDNYIGCYNGACNVAAAIPYAGNNYAGKK